MIGNDFDRRAGRCPHGWVVLAKGLHVAGDSDDPPPLGLFRGANVEFLPDRICVFEILLGHSPVDHGHLKSAGLDFIGERASAKQGDSHRVEIVWGHYSVVGFRGVTLLGLGLAAQQEVGRSPKSGQWEEICGGGRLHSG